MVGARHHGGEAGIGNSPENPVVVGRHGDRAAIGLARPFGDMDDHRLAANIGERLARQPSGCHPGGDEYEWAHGSIFVSGRVSKSLKPKELIGVAYGEQKT